MLNLCLKLFGRLYRFTNAVDAMSLISAVKIFLSRSSTLRSILVFGQTFYYRGTIDKGVVSHFYKTGYVISENNSKKKISYIIDAGANIGDETLRFRIHNPNAMIIAIEPSRANFEVLRKNFENDTKVELINKGLWSKECNLKIKQISNSYESFTVEETTEKENGDTIISAITVDQIMSNYNIHEIDILKLDIEGAERELFTSECKNWFPKVNCFIFEVSDLNQCITQSLYKNLKDEYNSFISGENIVLIRKSTDWNFKNVIGFDKSNNKNQSTI